MECLDCSKKINPCKTDQNEKTGNKKFKKLTQTSFLTKFLTQKLQFMIPKRIKK